MTSGAHEGTGGIRKGCRRRTIKGHSAQTGLRRDGCLRVFNDSVAPVMVRIGWHLQKRSTQPGDYLPLPGFRPVEARAGADATLTPLAANALARDSFTGPEMPTPSILVVALLSAESSFASRRVTRPSPEA
jgi:hypothetical protein